MVPEQGPNVENHQMSHRLQIIDLLDLFLHIMIFVPISCFFHKYIYPLLY